VFELATVVRRADSSVRTGNRQQQQWSLMPVHGMLSCVRPASLCYGGGGGYPSFPSCVFSFSFRSSAPFRAAADAAVALSLSIPSSSSSSPALFRTRLFLARRWLGKNSTQNKLQRALSEIQVRMRLRVSGDKRELRQSYLPTLFPRLVEPLQEHGVDGVEEVIELMDEYYLGRDEWDAIVELGVGDGRGMEEVLKKIPSQTKAAFTRKCVSRLPLRRSRATKSERRH